MADTKVSALTELAAEPAADDELLVVDKSDATMAASGTDKRMRYDRVSGLWVPKSLVDAAGDLLVGSAADALTRLAVGSPGAPLTADPTATNKVAWGTPAHRPIPPTGVAIANFDRSSSSQTNAGALVSGTMRLVAIWLPAGYTVTSIGFASGTTALTTSGVGPHFWVALYNSTPLVAGSLLRQSTDDTAATWAANSMPMRALSSPFVTTYAGVHYLAINVVCGSTGVMPTVTVTNHATTALSALAPIIHGVGSTGLTGTAPDPSSVLTPVASTPYCGVA